MSVVRFHLWPPNCGFRRRRKRNQAKPAHINTTKLWVSLQAKTQGKLKEYQQLPYLTVLREIWFILPVLRPVSSHQPGRLTWRPVGAALASSAAGYRPRRRVTGRVAQSGTRGRETHGQSVRGLARRFLNLTLPPVIPDACPRSSNTNVKDRLSSGIQSRKGSRGFCFSCELRGERHWILAFARMTDEDYFLTNDGRGICSYQ